MGHAVKNHRHRVWVYQNNVYAAIQDYMAELYPAVCGVVGEDFFKQMVQCYLQESAPNSGNIHRYGESFHSIINRFEGLDVLLYLHDLMRFEWAMHAAYFADTGDVLATDSVDQERLLSIPIQLNKSVCLIESKYPLHEIHRQSLPDYADKVAVNLAQGGENVLVYKQDEHVKTCEVSSSTVMLLNAIDSSDNLLDAIQETSEQTQAEDLSNALALIFEAELLNQSKS
jgi:hypothetical protein